MMKSRVLLKIKLARRKRESKDNNKEVKKELSWESEIFSHHRSIFSTPSTDLPIPFIYPNYLF